jgi:hypothetical protein
MTYDGYNRAQAVFVGALTGAATVAVYTMISLDPGKGMIAVVLSTAMGPLLLIASWGLREFVTLDRRRLTADLGAAANGLAGALVTASLLVQLAIKDRTDDPSEELKAVWLGLDAAWDVYIGLGTVLFALSAYRHPRLGRVVGASGLGIGVLLIVLNLIEFQPHPPMREVWMLARWWACGIWW